MEDEQGPPSKMLKSASGAAIATRGESTNDAPGEAEEAKQQAQSLSPFWKSSLCSFFRKHKQCRHGEACKYAHGESELRPRPDGSWDPTSQRGGSNIQPLNRTPDFDDFEDHLIVKCIANLPDSWGEKALADFLKHQNVPFSAAKKKKQSTTGFIGCECEEHTEMIRQKIDGKRFNNRIVKILDALPSLESSKQADNDENDSNIHPDTVKENADGNNEKRTRSICDVVTPLARLPYEEQLKKKKDEIAQVLKRLVRNVRKALPPGNSLPDWMSRSKHEGGLPCDYQGIIPSPLVDGYRNKCEFTIGHSIDGQRVVGFQLGNFRDGVTAVEEPSKCRNVSTVAQFYAEVLQGFVKKSELPVWDKSHNKGFWRLFTVREGRAASNLRQCNDGTSGIAEVMLIVQVCTGGVDDNMRNKEYKSLAEAFTLAAQTACPPMPLTALIIQDHQGLSNAASPDSPLFPIPLSEISKDGVLIGEIQSPANYIHEHICNLRFRLSATSFFQVNSAAAEKLYNLVADWAELSQDTLVFDVCCGTGTIGLTLAHRAGMVIGIELNASAVEDARINAKINGVENSEFICSKAEDVIDSLLEKYVILDSSKPNSDSGINERSAAEKNANEMGVVNGNSGSVGGEEREQQSNVSKQDENCSILNGNNQYEGLAYRKFKNVVVIVDPPRSGLHPTVVKALRKCEQLHRLIYVSCNSETMLANAVELCTPVCKEKETKGKGSSWGGRNMGVVGQARQRLKSIPYSQPFMPVKAVAVDLFPHSDHCEMVMLMER